VNYSLHRGAEQDLLEAARFYKKEAGSRLANRFLTKFERVAELLIEHPKIGTPVDELRRVFLLTDFPYSVIYNPSGDHIRILVVRHQHRDPEHGEFRR
jgi:plasmid stabilization system protein ParE